MSTNVNDPWNNAASDPLSDIASAIDVCKKNITDTDPTIYITEDCPFYKEIISVLDFKDAATVVVIKGSAVGRSEYINVGTPGHINYDKPNFITVNDEFAELCRSVQDDARRYMVAPEPVIEKPNNKPWYQDRKHFKNKKSRRKL